MICVWSFLFTNKSLLWVNALDVACSIKQSSSLIKTIEKENYESDSVIDICCGITIEMSRGKFICLFVFHF